jgi:hypothetical protein
MARPQPALSPRTAIVAWFAFVVALGPLWSDLVSHALAEPWARGSFVFAGLLGVHALLERRGSAVALAPRLGLAVVVFAAIYAVLFIGAALPRFARPAIPIGAIGLAVAYGRPSPAVAGLSLWMLSLPEFLLAAGHPLPAELWLQAGSALAPVGRELPFPMEAMDSGLGLAWLCMGLGYHAALRLRRPPLDRAVAAVVGALAAPLLQIAGFSAALWAAGAPLASVLLREGPWIAATALGLGIPELLRMRQRLAG